MLFRSVSALALALAAPAALAQGGGFTSSGVTLLSQVTPVELSSAGATDVWGYVSPAGREYAVICTDNGTAFVEVTDPSNPQVVHFHDGPDSATSDPKVYAHAAYVGSEGGGGLQVFDLSAIDAGVVSYAGAVTAGGSLNTHNLVVDPVAGFLYRVGTSSTGVLIYDLKPDPLNPTFVTSWDGHYVHDAQAHTFQTGPAAGREVLLACAGNSSSGLWVLDVTDKQNIQVMSKVSWPQQDYSHQGWLDESERWFYLNDESDETSFGLDTTTIVIDLADPYAAQYAGRFDNGLASIGHDGYVKGNLLYEANYTSGLRIFDLSVSPTNPPEVAWFDSWAPNDDPDFDGMWSVYPWLPSGVLLCSDRSAGLLVLYAGSQLLTIAPAGTAPALLSPAGQSVPFTITESTPGSLVPGSETLHWDDGGGWQSAPLVPQGGASWLAQFPGLACGATVDWYVSAQSSNGLSWYAPFAGAGAPYTSVAAASETVLLQEDFEQAPGWITVNLGASAGDFELGVPVDDPGWAYDPVADADGSGRCYLTENAPGNTDVDGGGVRLRSPDLDLSGSFPVVQYDYYLNLTDESGTDALTVDAWDLNGAAGWIEVARHATSGGTAWRTHQLVAADFLAAGVVLSDRVSLRFDVEDAGAATIVEAGIDAFVVKSLDCGVVSYCTSGTSASGCSATLSATGTPSLSQASGFDLTAAGVEGNVRGLFYFGANGRQASPWGNGTSYQCVVPPVKRSPIQDKAGTAGACDGSWTLDLNAYLAAKPQKAPSPGVPVQVQLWYRDPQSTSNQTTSLSDALEFVLAP